MNKRIKELELMCYEECGDYHLGSIRQLNVEKFAELIMQECANHILSSSDRYRKEYFANKVLETFNDAG
jgi:hypothetical protein